MSDAEGWQIPVLGERDTVVGRLRESLPEFAERNNLDLSDETIGKLAAWVASSMPPGLYRGDCPNRPDPCACPAQCMIWYRVPPGLEDGPPGKGT